MSANELGVYLRTCRESITPAAVGLPAGSRRRTPGLRRSELAALADISVEYLVRLEQGRDHNPSAQVLGALADALRLPLAERAHLRALAKVSSGDKALCPTAAPTPAETVRPTVRLLLDQLEPTPAVLLNRLDRIIAMTSGFDRLVAGSGLLDAPHRSVPHFVFTDPRAKELFPDWAQVADRTFGDLSLAIVRADPFVMRLVDELTVLAGAEFAGRRTTVTGPAQRTGVERWRHPDVGELRLAYEILDLPASDEQRLMVYLPADPTAAAGLDRLTGRHPGALRAIPS